MARCDVIAPRRTPGELGFRTDLFQIFNLALKTNQSKSNKLPEIDVETVSLPTEPSRAIHLSKSRQQADTKPSRNCITAWAIVAHPRRLSLQNNCHENVQETAGPYFPSHLGRPRPKTVESNPLQGAEPGRRKVKKCVQAAPGNEHQRMLRQLSALLMDT